MMSFSWDFYSKSENVVTQDSGCGFTMEELVTSELSGPWLEDISPHYSQEQAGNSKPKITVERNVF